jgi:DNA-binding MarR family transcriptional regulator
MNDTSGSASDGRAEHDFDLLAVFPHLARLSSVFNRGRLPERAMERTGLTLDRPAMSVLVILRLADRPLRIGEIAQRMEVVGPHVTRQLNTLERRRLARRVTDPHDQRARLIELTPEGAAAADRYLGTVLGWFAEAMAGWSTEERRTFGRLLARFADDVADRLAALDDEEPDEP